MEEGRESSTLLNKKSVQRERDRWKRWLLLVPDNKVTLFFFTIQSRFIAAHL